MTKKHTADLHCHLNGSFSLDYLKKTAVKHDCLKVYEQFELARTDYLRRSKQQADAGFTADVIALIWQQFALIHQIIQTPNDIANGVVDVVEHSDAKYIEIRTTAKAMGDHSRDQYIAAFELGLLTANEGIENKTAIGLLSVDRTKHTLTDAIYFIEKIKTSQHQVIKGLDISGDPTKPRSLSADDLSTLISLCLEKGIPIAIHMAEANSVTEQKDTDTILTVLEEWLASQALEKDNPLDGKVRFGHCIHLNNEQKKRIGSLQVAIEVCPTCHSKLNWHLEKSLHPVTEIYQDISEPLVVGTDDEVIFGASSQSEFDRVLDLFSNKHQLSRKKIEQHQAKYRFSKDTQGIVS